MTTMYMVKDFSRNKIVFLLFIFLWGASVIGGFVLVSIYQANPGTASNPPALLSDTHIAALASIKSNTNTSTISNQPSLLVFLHPQCFCSQASLTELNRLLHDVPQPPKTFIYFADITDPNGADIKSTLLWQQAKNIPHAIVEIDHHDKIARQLNVATSGDMVLYSNSGQLLFHGGITEGRGHQGDSAGRDALLLALINNNANKRQHLTTLAKPILSVPALSPEFFTKPLASAVYGCALIKDSIVSSYKDDRLLTHNGASP